MMKNFVKFLTLLFMNCMLLIPTKVTAFEMTVSESMDVYQIKSPLSITWTVEYDKTMVTKAIFLNYHKGGQEIKLANSMDGIKETTVSNLFAGRINVSDISPYSVRIKIHELFYTDVMNFTCEALGGTFTTLPKTLSKTVSIKDVKGGISPCGCHFLETEYIFPPGISSFPLTFCGNPRPKLEYTIGETTLVAEGKLTDPLTQDHKYDIKMKLKPEHCGQSLKLNVKGFRDWKNESKIWVKYTPSKVHTFQFIKNASQSENCTIFKMPNQNYGNCFPKFNVYIYNTNKTLIEEIIGITENQLKKCYTNQTEFNQITYANVEAVWMGLVGPMFDNPLKYLFLNEGVETTSIPSSTTTTTPFTTPNTTRIYNTTVTSSPEPEKQETKKKEWSPYYNTIIMFGGIVFLVLLIFLIHYLKTRSSRTSSFTPDEEVVLNYEVDTKKGSYDLTDSV